MSAVIRRFRSASERLRRDQVARARGELVELSELPGLPASVREDVSRVLVHLDGITASQNRWSFLMLSPSQNLAVVRYLRAEVQRSAMAMELWALCFDHLRTDTGEIILSRFDFAQRLGVSPRRVSEVMSKLVAFGAISVLREGRGVRYFMNPNVGTHLSGAARDAAQRAAGSLKVVDGGKYGEGR